MLISLAKGSNFFYVIYEQFDVIMTSCTEILELWKRQACSSTAAGSEPGRVDRFGSERGETLTPSSR